MKADVVYVNPADGAEQVEVDGHRLQFGGQADGYCYFHQSFDCIVGLGTEQWDAIAEAAPET